MRETNCRKCGYSLRGLLDQRGCATCPECGEEHEQRRITDVSLFALRWQVPLGIGVVALFVCVVVTLMAGTTEPGAMLLMFVVVPMSGLLLWGVTWVTWATADPFAMRYKPWHTALTGAAIGLGVGVLTMVMQVMLIIVTAMILSGAKSMAR